MRGQPRRVYLSCPYAAQSPKELPLVSSRSFFFRSSSTCSPLFFTPLIVLAALYLSIFFCSTHFSFNYFRFIFIHPFLLHRRFIPRSHLRFRSLAYLYFWRTLPSKVATLPGDAALAALIVIEVFAWSCARVCASRSLHSTLLLVIFFIPSLGICESEPSRLIRGFPRHVL